MRKKIEKEKQVELTDEMCLRECEREDEKVRKIDETKKADGSTEKRESLTGNETKSSRQPQTYNNK